MKRLHVNTKDTSNEELTKLARKCGFKISRGGKHDKISTIDGRAITTIPRNRKVKRETAKGIVEQFIKYGGNIEFT